MQQWNGFDLRGGLEAALGKPVTYLNDGNAAALWGHSTIFGLNNQVHFRLRDHRHRTWVAA